MIILGLIHDPDSYRGSGPGLFIFHPNGA